MFNSYCVSTRKILKLFRRCVGVVWGVIWCIFFGAAISLGEWSDTLCDEVEGLIQNMLGVIRRQARIVGAAFVPCLITVVIAVMS